MVLKDRKFNRVVRSDELETLTWFWFPISPVTIRSQSCRSIEVAREFADHLVSLINCIVCNCAPLPSGNGANSSHTFIG